MKVVKLDRFKGVITVPICSVCDKEATQLYSLHVGDSELFIWLCEDHILFVDNIFETINGNFFMVVDD